MELLEERMVLKDRGIFREGEEGDGLVLVAEGRVRIESRRGVDLGDLHGGCAFGGLSLLVLGKRECSVIALTDCQVLQLSRNAFRRLVEDAPRTACRLLEAVVNQFATGLREQLDPIVIAIGDSD